MAGNDQTLMGESQYRQTTQEPRQGVPRDGQGQTRQQGQEEEISVELLFPFCFPFHVWTVDRGLAWTGLGYGACSSDEHMESEVTVAGMKTLMVHVLETQ